MWDEDPRWQQSQYRTLVWAVAIGLIGSSVISIFSGDWQIVIRFLEALGVILAALGLYAAFAWTVAHLGVVLYRKFKRLAHRHDDA